MKLRLFLRPKVPIDILDIAEYMEQASPDAGMHFATAIWAALNDLTVMPGKGSLKNFRHTRLREIRSWSDARYRNYLILYRATDDILDVIAVVDGRRRLRKLLLDRV
jgi:plasmid stabilization system protein ParE